jgi:GT2 family glycosyltransferase
VTRSDAGVVIIGRNEGDRLKRCLASVAGTSPARVVYVDSGSTDGSVAAARAAGVEVLELDLRAGFTAARARNEGFRRLREIAPSVSKVQFVDGDCEMVDGWLDRAAAWLDAHPQFGVACGRRRERHPERSLYNMLCDIEWDTPVGEAKACGGDAMIRVDAFDAVGGYRADLIAGEDPELCVRLRGGGWRIWRLDADMTLHDAAMIRFAQWWTRTLRCGYAYAQGVNLHGARPERHCVREARSAWCWALGIPASALGLSLWWGGWSAMLLAVYPAQVARLALQGGRSPRENWWRAAFLVLGKFPELFGQLKFLLHRHWVGPARLIEYK